MPSKFSAALYLGVRDISFLRARGAKIPESALLSRFAKFIRFTSAMYQSTELQLCRVSPRLILPYKFQMWYLSTAKEHGNIWILQQMERSKKLCSAKNYSKIYCMTERMKHTADTVNSTAERAVVINLLFLDVSSLPLSLLIPTIINLNRIERPKIIPVTTYAVLRPDW